MDEPLRKGLPVEEGVHSRQPVISDLTPRRRDWSSSATMRDLGRYYTFFTHGLFFTHGGMSPGSEDPLQDWVNRDDVATEPLILDFSIPIFAGMGSDVTALTWSQRLLGVEREFWPYLRATLAGVAAVDRKRQRYWQATLQQITIADPLVLAKATVLPDPLPLVQVWVFGIDGSDGRSLFPEFTASAITQPTLATYPANPAIVHIAKQLIGHDIEDIVEKELERGSSDTAATGN